MDFGSGANNKRNNSSNKFTLAAGGVLCIVIGLFFLVSGVGKIVSPSQLSGGETTTAKVVDFKTEVTQDHDVSGPAYKKNEIDVPIYEFIDKSGETHRVVAHTYSVLQKRNVGDTVTLTYDPANPDTKYEVESEKKLDVIPIVAFTVGGVAAIVMGIVLLRKLSFVSIHASRRGDATFI